MKQSELVAKLCADNGWDEIVQLAIANWLIDNQIKLVKAQ